MSFAFLPLYTGDYRRDTQHLSPLRHGVYLLLLFHCWDTRGPVPIDEQECAGIANCRSSDEVDALRYILGRFFVRMEDGWYNERMQREIERAENISGARSEAGKKGYEARAQAIAKQVLSNCQASASTPTPTTTFTPTTIPTHKSKSKAKARPSHTASPVLARLPDGLWDEWRKHRGKKQTPQAETRQCATLEKLALQGEDLAAVVNQSIERGWSGLFPVDKKTNGSGNGGWWTSDGKTIAHGACIGLHPRPGESMSAFRDRINEKEGRK
jgi:uncharacterized protein YdaU (DUF1376 family)